MAFFSGLGGSSGYGDIVMFVRVDGNKEALKDLDNLNKSVTKSGQIMDRALTATALAGAAAFTAATLASAKFESQMADVNTLLDDSDKNFGNLTKGVLNLSLDLPKATETLTRGLYDLISAGADTATAVKSLGIAGKAATAGITSVDTSVRAGMSTINAYGLEMSSLNMIYDLQFSTVKKGVLTYEQLSNSLGNVLPSAASLGVSLEDLFGSIAAVTKGGIEAQSATTFLARAFESMVANRDDWKELGVAIFDTTGNFRGLQPVIGELAQELKGLSDEEKQITLESLDMEKRAAKAVLTMVNNYEGFKNTMDAVAGSSGAMEAAFSKQIATMKSQALILKNVVMKAFVELGDKSNPVLTDMLKTLNEHPGAIASVAKSVSTLAISVTALVVTFKAARQVQILLAASWGPHALAIAGVVAGLIFLKAAIDDYGESQRKELDNTNELILEHDILRKEYLLLSGQTERTATETDRLWKLKGKLKNMLHEAGLEANFFGKELAAATVVMDEMRRTDLQSDIDNINKKIRSFQDLMLNSEANGLVYAKALSKLQDELFKNEKELSEVEDALNGVNNAMDESTSSVDAGQKSIRNMTLQLIETNARYTKEFIPTLITYGTMQEALNDIGIKTDKQIKAEIESLNLRLLAFKLTENETFKIKEQIESLNKELTAEANTIDKSSKSWIDHLQLIGDLTGKMSNVSPVIGKTIDAFAAFALSPDPLTKGLTVVSLALDLFGGEEERVIFTTSMMIDSLDNAGLGIRDLKIDIDKLNSSFESVLIERLNNGLDDLIQKSTDARNAIIPLKTNSMELWVAFAGTKIEIALATEELKRFRDALSIKSDFDNLLSSSQSMNNEFAEMIRLFGVAALNGGPLKEMLEAQSSAMQDQLSILTPGTEAWMLLSEELSQTGALYAALNGSTNEAILIAAGVTDVVDDQTVSIEKNNDALKSTNSLWVDFKSAVLDGTSASLKFNNTAELLSAAGIKTKDSVLEQILFWEALIKKVDEGSIAYREIAGNLTPLYATFGMGNPFIEQQTEAVVELNNELKDLVLNWEAAFSAMFDEFSQFETDMKIVQKGIDQILFFKLDLDATQVDEQIAATIIKMNDFLGTLDPTSPAYQQFQSTLEGLVSQFVGIGGQINLDLNVSYSEAEIGLLFVDWWNATNPGTGYDKGDFQDWRAMMKLHTGGMVGSGAGGGTFQGRNEVPAMLLEGEAVIRPEISEKFSATQWQNFNETGDLSALGGGGGDIQVHIHDAGPLIKVSAFRENTDPFLKEQSEYTIKESAF